VSAWIHCLRVVAEIQMSGSTSSSKRQNIYQRIHACEHNYRVETAPVFSACVSRHVYSDYADTDINGSGDGNGEKDPLIDSGDYNDDDEDNIDNDGPDSGWGNNNVGSDDHRNVSGDNYDDDK